MTLAMLRPSKFLPWAVLVALLALSACHAPERRPRGSFGLKTIHPPTGRCGHFPWRDRPAEPVADVEAPPAAPRTE